MSADTTPQHPQERRLVAHITPSLANPIGAGSHVVIAVDTSGSLGRRGRLTAARDLVERTLTALDPADRVSLVAFADRATLLLQEVPAGSRAQVHDQLSSLRAAGGSNLSAVLTMVTALEADQVLIVTDGHANAGRIAPETLSAQARQLARSGAHLSTVGLGDTVNTEVLTALAQNGSGVYVHVTGPGPLPAPLSAQLGQRSGAADQDAVLRIVLPPGVQVSAPESDPRVVSAPGFAEVRLGRLAAPQDYVLRLTGAAAGQVLTASLSATGADRLGWTEHTALTLPSSAHPILRTTYAEGLR